jgi:RNA polymerase sigma-70 factor (ECF subfamily)
MSATANSMAIVTGATARGIPHESFDSIVLENQQRIYRVLLGFVRDPDLAAQLTQDCFVRAYEKRESFRGEAAISTWLVHIAVNIARDHTRNRRQSFWKKLFAGKDDAQEVDVVDTVVDRHASPEHRLLAGEQASAVWEIVETLPGKQREVFLLRFAEEMSLEEIAAAVGSQVGTVKSHLSRAVSTVRAKLKDRYREIALEHR